MADKPVALVTGASRGIGRAIALALSRTYAVVVNYRSSKKQAQAVAREIEQQGGSALVIQADVADGPQRQHLVDTVLQQLGRIDVLVNNAGISVPKRADLFDVDEEAWEAVLRVNLYAPFFMCQLAGKVMTELIARGTIQRGVIVNISSISAYAASTDRAAYCVAKAGLSMVTKLFAARLARERVFVYEVRPGIIRTDMTRSVQERYDHLFQEGLCPIARWGMPEDVARVVALLCTNELPYSTGEVINVDGGFHIRRL